MDKKEDSSSDVVVKDEDEAKGDTKSEGNKKDIETLLHHLYIAHELAINEDLSVYANPDKENTKESDENVLRCSLSDAYWDLFKEQISENPPKLDMAFDLLSEIKKGLELVMTPNITRLRAQVSQVLDLTTLRTQAEHGAIDVMYYAKFILSAIAKICAPVRDKDVAKLSKETDVVSLFRGIMEVLSLMKYDLISFSLAAIKPNIMANHLAYERDTFREYVEATGGNLPLTTSWLSKHKDPTKEAKAVVNEAFVDLLTWDNSEPYPETLFLEEERLKKLKLEYFRLTVSCTILFLSLGLLPKELHGDDTFKTFFKSFIVILMSEAKCDKDVSDLTRNIVVELDSKLSSSLPSRSVTDRDAEFKLYQETVEQAALPDNKIRQLVSTRVNDYLKTTLSTRSTADEHFPPALVLFKKELNSLRILYESIFAHNMLVCMEHYTALLSKLTQTDSGSIAD